MAAHREHFRSARTFAEADRFVFLDESGAHTDMTRLYGRSPRGQRCCDHTPAGKWQTVTLLAAIRSTGVIDQASLMAEGPMTGVLFLAWVTQWLAPSLKPGDIVVMDNLSCHKVAGVEEAIEAAGASVWYLPPYSPDLNPIELAWSKVKAWLRRAAARTREELLAAVAEALRRITADDCNHFLQHCGYER